MYLRITNLGTLVLVLQHGLLLILYILFDMILSPVGAWNSELRLAGYLRNAAASDRLRDSLIHSIDFVRDYINYNLTHFRIINYYIPQF